LYKTWILKKYWEGLMTFSRRDILTMAAAGAAAKAVLDSPLSLAASPPGIRAVAFDGFPILDPRPVVALAKELYPDKGDAFFGQFRTRLFEYQWLRALGGRYKDFFAIIDDAHRFAAAQLGLDATDEKRARLREAFLALKAWPDVAPALEKLKAKDIRLAFLSNMTASMLNAGIANSHLDGMFEFVLSTDAIKTYKPDRRAYQLGVDAFKLPKEQIAFAAFAGWDVAGATWFGYPTIWINRLDSPPEQLGVEPSAIGSGLDELVRFVNARA
jgi:2-haloacid dehalogenase